MTTANEPEPVVEEPDRGLSDWQRRFDASIATQGGIGRKHGCPRPMSRISKVVLGVFVAFYAFVAGWIVYEGVVRHDIAAGGGLRGSVTLTCQCGPNSGRYTQPSWQGDFTGDDGSVVHRVHFVEPIPDADRHVGARVSARWDTRLPTEAFLAESNAFTNWVEGAVFFAIVTIGVGAALARRWRRRVRHRETCPDCQVN